MALLGLLLGLAFCLRFHLAPALLAVAFWACRTEWRGRWLPLLVGAAAPVLVLGFVDFLAWGTPFQSIWKNFWLNVVEGRSRNYGTAPPFWYFAASVESWGWAAVPIGALFLIGARRAPLFAACAVLIWLSHMALAHKEMRFLYPATPFIIIVAGIGTLRVLAAVAKERGTFGAMTLASTGAWVAIALAVAVGDGFRPRWMQGSVMLAVQTAAGRKPDLCGLGIVGVPWSWTGGYAHLGRRVPIHLHMQSRNGSPFGAGKPDADALSRFNYAIAPDALEIGGAFAPERCQDGICLHRRDGGCTAGAPAEANRHLAAAGE